VSTPHGSSATPPDQIRNQEVVTSPQPAQ
jgi:hypothetical protein